MSQENKYLWVPRKNVQATIQEATAMNEIIDLMVENDNNFVRLLKWLRQAYTEQEVIKILLDCEYDRNMLPNYGFQKTDIIAVLDEYEAANEDYETEDDD